MAKKRTRAMLEEQIRHLEVYQALTGLLLAGERPVTIDRGEGNFACKCELYGAHRAHGGIVVMDGTFVSWADDAANDFARDCNDDVQELARKVRAEQRRAIDRAHRLQAGGAP